MPDWRLANALQKVRSKSVSLCRSLCPQQERRHGALIFPADALISNVTKSSVTKWQGYYKGVCGTFQSNCVEEVAMSMNEQQLNTVFIAEEVVMATYALRSLSADAVVDPSNPFEVQHILLLSNAQRDPVLEFKLDTLAVLKRVRLLVLQASADFAHQYVGAVVYALNAFRPLIIAGKKTKMEYVQRARERVDPLSLELCGLLKCLDWLM